MSTFIPDTVKLEVLRRAGGQCECTMSTCNHHRRLPRCPRSLAIWPYEFHHVDRYGPSVASNIRVLCKDCHENTPSFGTPR